MSAPAPEGESGRLLAAMRDAAAAAAKIQLAEFRVRPAGWGTAKAARDFVSFVDVESENAIRAVLDAALPGAAFYGEETERTLGTGATWIVDPLDGTTNYLSGFDHWSVSIALWRDGGPELGWVLKPATGEHFSAARGQGARRDGRLLERAAPLDPAGALVCTGTPYRSPDTLDAFFAATRGVLSRCRDLRRTGSAALDLCYVAAGFFQAFWEVDLQPYDVAAGLLMLSETGHAVSSIAGKPYDPFRSRSLVAGRSGAFDAVREAAAAAYGPLD